MRPHDYDEGWETLFNGSLVLKRLVHRRLLPAAMADDVDVKNPAIGRFEGKDFDPPAWTPRVPTAAFLRARDDDTFWAARRVWRSWMT